MPELKNTIAMLFLEGTKLDRALLNRGHRPNILPAEPFKRYKNREKVLLKRKWQGANRDLWETLQNRRTRRNYKRGLISLEELSVMLWASQGLTAQAGPYYLRTAPSAGALYPIETYIGINMVEGVDAGLYHFDVKGFQLETLKKGNFMEDIVHIALGQGFIKNASCIFIWTAVFRRTMCKYGNRGMRYCFIDVAHICQNLLLAAETIGLGACPIAAFFDDEMNDFLEIDNKEESAIYMACIGRSAES